MVKVILSLGSNSGQREKHIEAMERELSSVLQAPIARSRLMETEPLETIDAQPWYLNRIIGGCFGADAHDLLYTCREIEVRLGRERPFRHAARTADIDILLFGDCSIRAPDLHIPHPALYKRRFCIEGVNDIAPEFVLQEKGITVREYRMRLPETIRSQKIRFYNRIDTTHIAGVV